MTNRKKYHELYGCSFAQRCILKKQSRTFLTDQREVNRTKTRKNMFFLILFGFYHVFLTGRTAAKNNIQFQPYRSLFLYVERGVTNAKDFPKNVMRDTKTYRKM